MPVDFTIARDAFLPIVDRVKRVVEKRTTIPILGNIRLSAEAGRIAATGTDLDIWATAYAPDLAAKIHQPGEITVPAALLSDILKKASGEVRFCDLGDGKVVVEAGRSRFKLNALPASDMPDFPASPPDAAFTLGPDVLTRIDDACSFAISTEETRYYLNGIYLHQSNDPPALIAVATDGHKLSRLSIERPESSPFAGIIIPSKTVGLFAMLADAAGDSGIRIGINASRITFEAGDLTIASKLIDGNFPDYERVIPKGNSITAGMSRADLLAAVDRVASITPERGRSTAFTFSREALRLTMSHADTGSAEDEIACEGPEDELVVGFNAAYAMAILKTFKGERFHFALADPGAPAIVTDPADEDRLVVLMPMRA